MNITINRLFNAPDTPEYRATTTGILSLDGTQKCFTLEPTALMIPAGTYPVKMLPSHRFNRNTPHLDVPGRTFIEIHAGNWATDSEGCILVAEKRLSDYMIQESPPATDLIETRLSQAEASGELNTVTVG